MSKELYKLISIFLLSNTFSPPSQNTLTYGNLSNNSFSSSKSIGANANFNLSRVNDKNQDVKKGISSVGYNASNSLSGNVRKTLATSSFLTSFLRSQRPRWECR